jgi:ketosteroid isomerase-like protein
MGIFWVYRQDNERRKAMNQASLQQFFERHFAVMWGEGPPEDLLDVISEDALLVDEDTPFIFDKDEFKEHMDWHMSGLWERFAWKPREISYVVVGNSGLVSGNFSIHGKPRDAGYRQRDGMFSIVCDFDARDSKWQVLKFHSSPLFSAIHHNSPG